ncbi:FK506-binding protein 1 [Trichoderma asperellum]|uniref:peptidylprolyl isomerase n=1 Tax=Trichoderma asperellum TaxID=101201 RepID=A0A6V8QYL1_TRIAP|nr:FK506-binding protein 1 [Trichoderma asperellum]
MSQAGYTKTILQEGSGEGPKSGAIVAMHYTGWLKDTSQPENKGAKFDSSLDRGETFNFKLGVGQVIQGWDLGVATMKPGEKARLDIESKLGYGSRGAGGVIPPNADLIFDVELIRFKQ